MSVTRDVIEFAKGNGGIFTTHDAAAIGMSDTVLGHRVANGIFVRVHHAVYALPGTSTRPDLMMRVACQTLDGVVSHESAGDFHDLKPIIIEQPSITVSHRSTHTFPGIRVHQSTDLMESHVMTQDGLRITTPERTIIDLAKTTGVARLRRIIDNGLASGRVDFSTLYDLHTSLARKGKRGTARLRQLLDERTGEPEITPSELEARLLLLLQQAGLPEPVREYKAPWLKPIEGRVDFAYVDRRLLIEGDSRRWHALFDAFEEDRRRDNAAQLAGWRVLRFTWRMIVDEREEVVAAIRMALYDVA